VPKNSFELNLPSTCTSFYEFSGLKKLSIWVGFWTLPYQTNHSWSRTYFFCQQTNQEKTTIGSLQVAGDCYHRGGQLPIKNDIALAASSTNLRLYTYLV